MSATWIASAWTVRKAVFRGQLQCMRVAALPFRRSAGRLRQQETFEGVPHASEAQATRRNTRQLRRLTTELNHKVVSHDRRQKPGRAGSYRSTNRNQRWPVGTGPTLSDIQN